VRLHGAAEPDRARVARRLRARPLRCSRGLQF